MSKAKRTKEDIRLYNKIYIYKLEGMMKNINNI